MPRVRRSTTPLRAPSLLELGVPHGERKEAQHRARDRVGDDLVAHEGYSSQVKPRTGGGRFSWERDQVGLADDPTMRLDVVRVLLEAVRVKF